MDEVWLSEQENDSLSECDLYWYEQQMLAADAGYEKWLDKVQEQNSHVK